jgi:hypothetical protein
VWYAAPQAPTIAGGDQNLNISLTIVDRARAAATPTAALRHIRAEESRA